MGSRLVVAIAGATGLVGSEMLSVLDERKFPYREIRLLASQDSVGEVYKTAVGEAEVALLDDASFQGVDIALFATSAELSARFIPHAVAAGAIAIDNSSHYRLNPEVPLIVPEVNIEALKPEHRIIANPNCSTIQLVPVLKAVQDFVGIRRVVLSTYQSVSGAGKAALDELWGQLLAIFNQRGIETEVFPHQIAFNVIPQVDVILDDGSSREEFKIVHESRKILGLPELRISATAVRVPVMYAHSESVNIETERPASVTQLTEVLAATAGINVYSEWDTYPTPLDAASTDDIHVGRIRRDESVPNGFNLWVVSDNVRKGAALNAVQIAEGILARGLMSN